MSNLGQLLGPHSIRLLDDMSKENALIDLSKALGEDTEVEADRLQEAVLEREKLLSTDVGLGLAMPHVRLPEADQFAMAIGVSRQGIKYGAMDEKPVHIIVMVVGPAESHTEYMQFMASITTLMGDDETRRRILEAEDPDAIREVVENESQNQQV